MRTQYSLIVVHVQSEYRIDLRNTLRKKKEKITIITFHETRMLRTLRLYRTYRTVYSMDPGFITRRNPCGRQVRRSVVSPVDADGAYINYNQRQG